MAKAKFSIEEAFEQLEHIIEQLSEEEVSLADSMDLYKKGVKLLDIIICSHASMPSATKHCSNFPPVSACILPLLAKEATS